MMNDITAIEYRALLVMQKIGVGIRGSFLGWELWGESIKGSAGEGSHFSNKFCRPAGKVLKSLKRNGLVESSSVVNCTLWHLTRKGMAVVQDIKNKLVSKPRSR